MSPELPEGHPLRPLHEEAKRVRKVARLIPNKKMRQEALDAVSVLLEGPLLEAVEAALRDLATVTAQLRNQRIEIERRFGKRGR